MRLFPFIKGSDSTQEYLNQGRDVLSDEEIAVAKQEAGGVEYEKIASFLNDHPDTMVFALKRPDEFVGNKNLLSQLGEASLVCYAGGYNTSSPDRNMLKEFYEAPRRTAFSQNYVMLQNGDDAKPRAVTRSGTPLFSAKLAQRATPTANAIAENISLWNCKTIFDMLSKAAGSTSLDPMKAQGHENAKAALAKIMPDCREDFRVNIEICKNIFDVADKLDKNAILKNGKGKLGFRVKVLRQIADDPDGQVVIADPLALFATLHPGQLVPGAVGAVTVDKFVGVQADPEGRALNYGPIVEEPEAGETRIAQIDAFLTRMVLGQEISGNGR